MADTTTLAKTSEVFEYRGVDNLVYAKITKDGDNYEVGTPVKLAYVAEIGKTVETNSETKFYDNKPLIVLKKILLTTMLVSMKQKKYGQSKTAMNITFLKWNKN